MVAKSIRKALLVGTAIAFGGLSPAGADVEQRCLEIDGEPGGSCRCAESLDTSDASDDRGGFLNPGDSGNSKQCEGEIYLADPPAYSWYPTGFASPVAETGMPAGNSVSYVWRNTSQPTGTQGSVSHVKGMRSPLSSSRRICFRHYFKLSPGYTSYQGVPPGRCGANKVADMVFGEGYFRGSIQMADGRGGGNYGIWASGWSEAPYRHDGGGAHIDGAPSSVSTYDCTGEWCRAEVCVSSPTSLSDGRDNYLSGYYEVVTGPNAGKREQISRVYLGDMPDYAGGVMTRNMIIDMYREGDCVGTREFSHAMHAEWNIDNGQFIGAAAEVEGNLGGISDPLPDDVPPPPAPSAAPAPPVLLDN
jgi:hypothetical protein